MDDFKAIYRILKYLRDSMDCEIFDDAAIQPEAYRLSRARWERLLIMMQDEGYVKGINCTQSMSDGRARLVEPVRPEITLKGLEYLSENTMMRKAANLLKGINESVPGL